MSELIDSLKGGLIVSCQADEKTPLGQPHVIAALAEAAQRGGAAGIRANGPANLTAVCTAVSIPVIAIYKVVSQGSDVYITPAPATAREIHKACGRSELIVAFDATNRPRNGGGTWRDVLKCLHDELGVLAMADVSTRSEGIEAAEAGADIIATTLSGYTAYTLDHASAGGPDLALVAALAEQYGIPVVCEGRVRTAEDAAAAFAAGAHAVVVGTAITAIDVVTRRFVSSMRLNRT